ncbi:hypothetical protein BDL97_09G024200 [Sphagnum fallax]|nr:hypothetical protein BDL97_09G024200 [Sphagnum fallax]
MVMEEETEVRRLPQRRLEAGQGLKARARHSLPGRLARAAGAALKQTHLAPSPRSLPLKVQQRSSPSDIGTGLFRSGALEAHISRALGNTLGRNGDHHHEKEEQEEAWNLFSTAKKLPPGVLAKEDCLRQMQLCTKHSVGARTMVEAMLQGTKVSLLEIQLRLLHSLMQSQHANPSVSKQAGHISFTAATDFQSRQRMTLESTMGCDDTKHSFSTVLSSDFKSRFSWGLASSHKVDQKSTLFSRFTSDANTGQRVIVQAVHKLDERNIVSPIFAATMGSPSQLGMSWTHVFTSNGIGEDSVQMKVLSGTNGSYLLSLKAQIGEVEQ